MDEDTISIRSSGSDFEEVLSSTASEKSVMLLSDGSSDSGDPDDMANEDEDQDEEDIFNEARQVDLMEIFSRPRLIPAIRSLGYLLRCGKSIDILTGHDLLDIRNRLYVRRVLQTERPKAVVLSPPCTMFSQLMNTNFRRMNPTTLRKRWQEAKILFLFAVEILGS